ncbi:MAG TPA: xylose isomerase [Planctomycetaceae bacterium]|nr:xylose isomerase [Planctomycetaceae bacterium]HIQ23107.1 xylose isomerase [Planctomycetota bacterium]
MAAEYRFSFGPWNIHSGADPFGPPVRPSVSFAEKLKLYKQLGFDGVQFHDDDAVPDMEELAPAEIERQAKEVKKMLDGEGLVAEFVAPRLWEDPRGIDGAFTSNDPQCRAWAVERLKRCNDIANALGTRLHVLWLAREGTYIREAKNAIQAHQHLIDAINALLEYDPHAEVAIEPKPNEPMDHAYIPTIGHALALAERTADPGRVGGLIETAHALLAGLDPSDEMAFALALGKLWSVHLNDQNGLKFDQDKTFGSANLRAAFNQVRVLELGGYAGTGRFVGLDVKAMRTQKPEAAQKHLANSREIFLLLVEKVRTFPRDVERQCIADRDYEALELAVLKHLVGS